MDKNKKELIELILDKFIKLEEFGNKIIDVFNIEAIGENELDDAFSIGYQGIPLIIEKKETDFLDDLFYNYITKRISKKDYFKNLEKYLKEEK